jgi:hypothetical protein
MKQYEAVARARQVLMSVVLILMLCSCGRTTLQSHTSAKPLTDRQVVVLNELRDEINSIYGFVDGSPRINRGPCGRFARIFHEEWNARFKEKINIVFVMMPDIPDGVGCDHVLVKLPDGSYYDGGGGVMSGATLLRQFGPGRRIEEMEPFDLALLDKRSYGLGRSYGLCPNYSDETTTKIVASYLDMLPKD